MANKSQLWTQWIYADAPRYGIDPEAARAIATHEGLSGAVGDAGTSFGPFQMHIGGALPSGRGRRWAESRAGVDYALRAMANAGARGLRGRAAISAISKKFERPANVAAEISDALAHYGRGGGAPRGSAGLPALARNTARGVSVPAGDPMQAQRMAMLSSLLTTINPNVAPILAMAANQAQAEPPMRTMRVAGHTVSKRVSGAKINELFYDPLGGIKNNQHIGAIGGHSDHVHMSLGTAAAQWRAIQQAKAMGLHVGQDTDANVTNVHVSDSYHYRKYNNKSPLRMAADVSGDPNSMAAFYKWVAANH